MGPLFFPQTVSRILIDWGVVRCQINVRTGHSILSNVRRNEKGVLEVLWCVPATITVTLNLGCLGMGLAHPKWFDSSSSDKDKPWLTIYNI